MKEKTERLHEIEARKAELTAEVVGENITTERLSEIKLEAEKLNREAQQIRGALDVTMLLKPSAAAEDRGAGKSAMEIRADRFRASGELHMPLFDSERRSLLVSSGKLAAPTAVYAEIGELPSVVSSIVDDVEVIDATGTESWEFPYKKADAGAAAVTEGSAVAGTGAAYDKVTISSGTWGVLDEVSNQVAKMTNVAYAANVQNSAYRALRVAARDKLVEAVLASPLAEARYSVPLDADFLRNVMLNFGSDESVGGGTKLYLNKADLYALGKVRGTNEKRGLYEISFTDENNGTIKEGGLSVPFSICSKLAAGTQLYGQPRSVKLLLWGDYEIRTNDGGDYFKRNMLGIRALVTAGADLTVYHGMQIIRQAAQSSS